MNIKYKYIALCLLMCLVSGVANAQKNKDKDKKEYPRRVKVWQLDENYDIKDYDLDRDTSMHLFQVYDYNDRNSLSVSNLGNMGSPYISNIFDDRERNRQSPVFFLDYMSDFVAKPEDTKFYQVNHPYTWLYYAQTPKARNGQVIDFMHTQNVNRYFNWGFSIGLVGSTGRISRQHMRNTTFTPQMSYNGKHLKIHTFYKFNKFYTEEYGGIVDSIEIKNNRFTTKLENTFSTWGRRTWGLIGEYSVGKTDFKIINDSTRTEIYTPRLAFNYVFSYDKIFRTYQDEDLDQTFYKEFRQTSVPTYDSLFFRCLTNKAQLKIFETQYLPCIRGGLGVENELYYNFEGYLTGNSNHKYTNSFIEGSISKNKSRNLILNGSYRQYITGRKNGDMYINGNLGFKLFKGKSDTVNYQIKAAVDFKNEEPTYFEQQYTANNFHWNNDFDKRQVLRIGGEIELPRWHLKAAASNYVLNNYVYINSNAVPQQASSAITVQSVSLMKDFFVWHVRFANRFTYQHSDSPKILNLPNFALYHSTYFEFFLVKNVLFTQIGGEVRYSDSYNAFGYAPATSLFYPATRLSAGDYPIINAFVNIKIRGVLMFFKWEHVNDGITKDWYAAADDYPIQDFHFMFGILWRFGD
ncbi:MAG: putative porin [Bacteroidales bacterium]|nr:putative porin [Bacteroidales bacterium]